MIALDSGVFAPDVVEELTEVLGPDAVGLLYEAFSAEMRVRPLIIAEQIAAGDLAAARRSAHYLRGAALIVGAGEVVAASERIEFSRPLQLADVHILTELAAQFA